MLIAYEIDTKGVRQVLGFSTELSEVEAHWCRFLKSLTNRGLYGLVLITSDTHEGLKATREAMLPTVKFVNFICNRMLGTM